MTTYNELETHGFLILKNVIDENEIQLLLEDFNNSKKIATDINSTNYKDVIARTNPLENKIKNILLEIAQHTTINLDIINPTVYFDNSWVQLEWHQDQQQYFKYQDAHNSINFWIPMIK